MYEKRNGIDFSLSDGILTITLDNPPLNSATIEAHSALAAVFEQINHDPDVKVVVLTGAGTRAFSAGGDIDAMIDRIEARDHTRWNQGMAEARRIIYGMLNLERPLIGRINGHAMGLGATLAAFCDVSYMMADARIADTHVNVGLTAGDGGALIWPLLMGFARARKHLLTGDPLTGREAAEAGLITQSTETVDELDALTNAMAARLAGGATLAINTTKISINLVLRNMLSGLIEAQLGFETQTAWTEDHLEAALAFKQKRPPLFKGV